MLDTQVVKREVLQQFYDRKINGHTWKQQKVGGCSWHSGPYRLVESGLLTWRLFLRENVISQGASAEQCVHKLFRILDEPHIPG